MISLSAISHYIDSHPARVELCIYVLRRVLEMVLMLVRLILSLLMPTMMLLLLMLSILLIPCMGCYCDAVRGEALVSCVPVSRVQRQ